MTLPCAILFDNDGVLSASEPLHWAAWGELLTEMGLPYHEPELRAMVGTTAPEIMVELLNRHQPGWDPARYDIPGLAQRKNEFYIQLARTGLKTYPGVIECLEWARARGIRTAVVSNARSRELEAVMKLLGLTALLDEIVSRDVVSAPKPDPAMYLYAAASLGFEPDQCLAVEDSPPGLEAALLARVPSAAISTNFSRAVLQTPVPGRADLGPRWIFASFADFFESLKELAAQ